MRSLVFQGLPKIRHLRREAKRNSKSSVQQCTVGSNPTLSARYFKASEHFARKPFFFAYDRLLAVCYGQAKEENIFMSVQSIKIAFLCLPSMDIILSEGTALFRRYPQQPAKGLFLPLGRVLPAGLPMRCRFRPLASLPDVPHATRLVSAAKISRGGWLLLYHPCSCAAWSSSL